MRLTQFLNDRIAETFGCALLKAIAPSWQSLWIAAPECRTHIACSIHFIRPSPLERELDLGLAFATELFLNTVAKFPYGTPPDKALPSAFHFPSCRLPVLAAVRAPFTRIMPHLQDAYS